MKVTSAIEHLITFLTQKLQSPSHIVIAAYMRIVILSGWERIGISVLNLGVAGLSCVIAVNLLKKLFAGAWEGGAKDNLVALIVLCIVATIGLGILGIAQLSYGINNLVDPAYAVIHLLMRQV